MTSRATEIETGETTASGTPETLSATTLRTLRAYFDQQRHYPSAAHWAALRDIAETLESMADDRAERAVYLSAIDPGVGKTQAVAHFARALVNDLSRRDVGMIVCVGRIAEAKAFAEGLAMAKQSFAVLTSDAAANALGSDDAPTAQVLITTQQRIERLCQGRGFGDVATFYYHGRPRQVRAWDEAWLPGVPLTLSYADIFEVVKPIQRRSKTMEEALVTFALDLRNRAESELMDVPDFAHGFDVPLFDITEGATLKDDQRQTLNAIRIMSGRAARVTVENRFGATALTYHDTLPDDLAPLLVLDASARVRSVYRFVERHRQGVRRLKEAVKRYDPLTVSLWKTSGGKTSFAEKGDELVKGIVRTILTKPDERWLIVAHKKSGRSPDIEKLVTRYLPADVRANVEVITWGEHMATNAYADVPNICLAGTLFMRPSYYRGLTQMAMNVPVADGFVGDTEICDTTEGEHANLILQALCRGRVRKLDGDQCLPMAAYIIASQRSGIPDLIPSIFPGCNVVDWNATEKKPSKKQTAALVAIRRALEAAPWVSYRGIAEGLAESFRNFRRDVLRKDWASHLSEAGLIESTGPRQARGASIKGGHFIMGSL